MIGKILFAGFILGELLIYSKYWGKPIGLITMQFIRKFNPSFKYKVKRIGFDSISTDFYNFALWYVIIVFW